MRQIKLRPRLRFAFHPDYMKRFWYHKILISDTDKRAWAHVVQILGFRIILFMRDIQHDK